VTVYPDAQNWHGSSAGRLLRHLPEAAMNEHRKPVPWEGHVRVAWQIPSV
jgi:hypothetical protein